MRAESVGGGGRGAEPQGRLTGEIARERASTSAGRSVRAARIGIGAVAGDDGPVGGGEVEG